MFASLRLLCGRGSPLSLTIRAAHDLRDRSIVRRSKRAGCMRFVHFSIMRTFSNGTNACSDCRDDPKQRERRQGAYSDAARSTWLPLVQPKQTVDGERGKRSVLIKAGILRDDLNEIFLPLN